MDTNNSNPSSTPSPRPHRPSRWPLFFIVVVAAIIAFTYFNRSEITEPDTPAIEWIHDYSAGFDLARKENKPVLLAFHADWCPPCKQMKAVTYHAPEVIEVAQNFITIMIDTDKEKQIVEQYRVGPIPAYIITTPDNETIDSFVNFHDAGAFTAKLKNALK